MKYALHRYEDLVTAQTLRTPHRVRPSALRHVRKRRPDHFLSSCEGAWDSLNVATVYVITRAANAIPEFRYRIRGGEVVEHEIAIVEGRDH